MSNNTNWSEQDLDNAGLELKPDGTYGKKTVVRSIPQFQKGQETPKGRVPAVSKVAKSFILPTIKENKKIRNATKSTAQDGTPTDSKLEATMYNLLKLHHINFEFKVKYELQPAFEYNGKKIQPISWTPDFTLVAFNMIVDTKGYSNDTAPIKIKIVKYALANDKYSWFPASRVSSCEPPEIIIIKNKEQCEKFINRLLSLK